MSISLQASLVQHLHAAYTLYNTIDIAVCQWLYVSAFAAHT